MWKEFARRLSGDFYVLEQGKQNEKTLKLWINMASQFNMSA